MSQSECFLLEDSLNGLHGCLDSVQREFIELRRRGQGQGRPTKKSRPAHNQQQIFKDNIKELRKKWSQCLEGIFVHLTDLPTYDKIINDLLKGIRTAKTRYKINDENYYIVFRSIVVCVVASMMDHNEVSKKSAEIQERRMYFLDELMTKDLGAESSIDDDGADSDIDVISIPTQNGTQVLSSTSCESSSSASINNTQSTESLCKSESIYVLDVLFDALSRHTQVVGKKDVDFRAHIYHIVNITYVVDSLQKYLKTLRERIQAAKSPGQAAINVGVLNQLRAAMQKYENKTAKNLEELNIGNPLFIFRDDLRKITSQLRLVAFLLS